MPQVGFEPKIPVFEWVKTVHTLDRAATVIDSLCHIRTNIQTHRDVWEHTHRFIKWRTAWFAVCLETLIVCAW
jgi:hypothetical protein